MVEIIAQSKVREFIKKRGLDTDGNSLDKLEKSFTTLLDNAIARAKNNDRKTLMARDS